MSCVGKYIDDALVAEWFCKRASQRLGRLSSFSTVLHALNRDSSRVELHCLHKMYIHSNGCHPFFF